MMQIKFYTNNNGFEPAKIDYVENSKLGNYLIEMFMKYNNKEIETLWLDNGICCDPSSGSGYRTLSTDHADEAIVKRVEDFGFCSFYGEFGGYENITIIDKESDAYCKSVVKNLI